MLLISGNKVTKKKGAYVRVSSREQAENTQALEQQEARVKAAGATEIFVEVQSGRKDNRPKLKELLDSVEKRLVSEVIVTRVDRLARSLPKLRQVIDVFLKSGVNLVFLDQSMDLSTPQGKLMANMLGSLAEWETDMLSDRVRHGKEHRRKEGKACEAAPWGYLAIDGKYVLDRNLYLCLLEDRPLNYLELKGDEVSLEKLPGRTVFELSRDLISTYLQQKSIRGALRVIFAKYGIQRTSAKINSHDKVFHWTQRGFSLWLVNPVLCGHTAYLKEDKNKLYLKNPEDWLILKNTHADQRLITDEEASEIQYLLDINKKIGSGALGIKANSSNHYREYAYQSGLVYCGECKAKCTVKFQSTQKKKYSYYACRHSGLGCNNRKNVKRQDIEAGLIKALVQKSKSLVGRDSNDLENSSSSSERVLKLQEKLKWLEENSDDEPELEKYKKKLRQQIKEEFNSSASSSVKTRTTEEIICFGNNLPFWQTLSNDDKVDVYPRLISKIFIYKGEVESVVFKL